MASTRSPSPNPSRPSSPNPKTLENKTRHKTGTLNPCKPCSGLENPLRNSGSKSASVIPSPRSSFEQKENERDPIYSNSARARSPSINPCKGMKSFMAPTISASSKITAATPRKTILAERNDVLQDSIDSRCASVEEVRLDETGPKSAMGSDSEELSTRNRSRIQSFSSSRSHHQSAVTRSSSCCLDDPPLDADPSLPPYDPMTNYLSPRPRFLHYKPKPKVEQNEGFMEDFADVGDGRRLEDSFSDSESSEDCSGYSEGTQSSPSEKELETESSVMKAHQPHLPDQSHASEHKPRSETYKNKTRLFTRSKLIPFLLVLIAVSFSLPLTDSPILSPSNIKYDSIDTRGYLAFANRNLQGIATRMNHYWSTHLSAILTTSVSFSKELEMPTSINMTVSSSVAQNADLDLCYSPELELPGQNDPVDESPGEACKIEFPMDVDGDVLLWKREKDSLLKYEEGHISFDDHAEKIDITIGEGNGGKGDPVGFQIMQTFEKQVPTELGDEDVEPMNTAEIDSSIGPIVDNQMMKKNAYPISKEAHSSFTGPLVESREKEDEHSDKIDISISNEVKGGGYPVEFEMVQKLEEQVDELSTHEHGHFDLLAAIQLMYRKINAIVANMLADTNLMLAALGMLATTVSIFLFMKQKKTFAASEDKSGGDAKRRKNADYSPHHDLIGLTEVVGDSGPTEMSYSLNTNLSHSQQMRKMIPSHEVIMQRRESAVSSSTSFGSFTALERLSAKKGNKDEDVMTPVRRSSRIKNQVTSS